MAVIPGLAAKAQPGDPLLRISGLSVELSGYRQSGTLVSDVDLEVRQNETVGVVGETGSGKSSLILAVLNLLPRVMRVSGGATGAGRGPGRRGMSCSGGMHSIVVPSPIRGHQ